MRSTEVWTLYQFPFLSEAPGRSLDTTPFAFAPWRAVARVPEAQSPDASRSRDICRDKHTDVAASRSRTRISFRVSEFILFAGSRNLWGVSSRWCIPRKKASGASKAQRTFHKTAGRDGRHQPDNYPCTRNCGERADFSRAPYGNRLGSWAVSMAQRRASTVFL